MAPTIIDLARLPTWMERYFPWQWRTEAEFQQACAESMWTRPMREPRGDQELFQPKTLPPPTPAAHLYRQMTLDLDYLYGEPPVTSTLDKMASASERVDFGWRGSRR